jgi:hypothetical protein
MWKNSCSNKLVQTLYTVESLLCITVQVHTGTTYTVHDMTEIWRTVFIKKKQQNWHL